MMAIISLLFFFYAAYRFLKAVDSIVNRKNNTVDNQETLPQQRIIYRNIKYPDYSKKSRKQN